MPDKLLQKPFKKALINTAIKPDARLFGEKTAGFTDGNHQYILSDGSWLMLAASWLSNRSGQVFKEAIKPDEASTSAEADEIAAEWLNKHCIAE